MTLEVTSAAPAPAPAPIMRPDTRPTADVAALTRDPRPDIPMPIPASNGQTAAVTQSKVSANVEMLTAVSPTERVLKPFGVAMLPETSQQDARPKADAEEQASAADKDAAEADRTAKDESQPTPVEAKRQEPEPQKAEKAEPPARESTPPKDKPDASS